MLSKKLLVGTVMVTLAVSSGAIAYDASPQNDGLLNGSQYQESISISGEGGLSFDSIDKNALPDGVQYQEAIFIEGETEGALRFDNANLPDGVQALDEISMDEAGALTFDEMNKDNLPDGVFYQDKISVGDAGGIPLN